VLESLTAKVPSIKERILAFLEGAKTDYAGTPRLEGAAKRYYKQYKKMFDEFAERNAGRNAQEASGEKRYALPEGYKPTKADKEYISALERGDMDAAQAMVDKAAKKAGYTVKAYHGTKATFTVFDKSKIRSGATLWASQGDGFYFTENKDVANKYSKVGKVVDAFLKIENAFVFVDKKNNTANKLLKEFAQQNGRDFDINEYSNFVDFDKRTGTVLSRVVVGDGEAFTKFLQAKKIRWNRVQFL
jgi:hypothetical protein